MTQPHPPIDHPTTNASCSSALAPIGLSVYGRLEHLRKTVAALRANTLAKSSVLHIFSDAPRPGDEEKVAALRAFLRTIDGFRDVIIVERVTNSRVANNRGGQRQLVDTYGKMIWMEEDIVTAPGFLEFVNRALLFYAPNPRVFSITGYTPPIMLPPSFTQDAFALTRFNAWGFGIWKDRYLLIREIAKSAVEVMNRLRLTQNGYDLHRMAMADAMGRIDALDVKAMFLQACTGGLTIFPRKSLVQNIGHDGSGIHCPITQRFHHHRLWDKQSRFVFEHDVRVHEMFRMLQFIFRTCP